MLLQKHVSIPQSLIWWWCYPTPSEGWRREETSRSRGPNSRAKP